jgi:hypothetical protein
MPRLAFIFGEDRGERHDPIQGGRNRDAPIVLTQVRHIACIEVSSERRFPLRHQGDRQFRMKSIAFYRPASSVFKASRLSA